MYIYLSIDDKLEFVTQIVFDILKDLLRRNINFR